MRCVSLWFLPATRWRCCGSLPALSAASAPGSSAATAVTPAHSGPNLSGAHDWGRLQLRSCQQLRPIFPSHAPLHQRPAARMSRTRLYQCLSIFIIIILLQDTEWTSAASLLAKVDFFPVPVQLDTAANFIFFSFSIPCITIEIIAM